MIFKIKSEYVTSQPKNHEWFSLSSKVQVFYKNYNDCPHVSSPFLYARLWLFCSSFPFFPTCRHSGHSPLPRALPLLSHLLHLTSSFLFTLRSHGGSRRACSALSALQLPSLCAQQALSLAFSCVPTPTPHWSVATAKVVLGLSSSLPVPLRCCL